MSTSLIVNHASDEHNRISQADKRSIAPPILPPKVAAIIGFGHSELIKSSLFDRAQVYYHGKLNLWN